MVTTAERKKQPMFIDKNPKLQKAANDGDPIAKLILLSQFNVELSRDARHNAILKTPRTNGKEQKK